MEEARFSPKSGSKWGERNNNWVEVNNAELHVN